MSRSSADQWLIKVSVCPLQPPPADLDSLFLYIEDVMDVSSRLLSLLDQEQLGPGDPLYLQTLCETFKAVEASGRCFSSDLISFSWELAELMS